VVGYLNMSDSATRQLTLWSADDAVDPWTIRESPRARRLSVRVSRTGRVEVVVPPRTSQRTVARFLDQHRQWIEERRAEMARNAAPAEPFPPPFIELAGCNERWRVHVAGGNGRARAQSLAPGLIELSGNPGGARLALRRWLIAKAYEVLEPLLAQASREMGTDYKRLSIRRQRTRWGSCSARGTISLNCTALFQRPQVARYLLIHELAHTRHMNHSAKFWNCVARYCEDYKRLDRELREGWRRVPQWVFER